MIHNTVISNSIGGCNDNDDIMNVFRDTYMSLYNSVPYDVCEMSKLNPFAKHVLIHVTLIITFL